jgi:hypothetical protein
MTSGQTASGAVGSGLPGNCKLNVVKRRIGSLASKECAGAIGSLGLRSEREGHTGKGLNPNLTLKCIEN